MTMTDPQPPAATPGPYAAAALTYYHAGWVGVLPLPPRKKGPVPTGWTGNQGAWPSYADVHAWTEDHPDSNLALRLPPGVIGIDVDQYDDKPGYLVLQALEEQLGTLPATWRSTSRDDGASGIRLYRIPEGLRWPGILGPGIEVLRTGHRYAVAWPSIHPTTDKTYRWITPDGATALGTVPAVDDLPDLPAAWIEHFTHGEQAAEQARANLDDRQASAWLQQQGTHAPPCRAMTTALTRSLADLLSGTSRHDAALAGTNRLVWLAGEGHTGHDDALTRLRTAFLTAAAGARDDLEGEWARMVAGAVRMAAAAHPEPNPDPCDDPWRGLIDRSLTWTTTTAPEPNTCPTPATTDATPSSTTTSPTPGSTEKPSTPASEGTSGHADGATTAQASTYPSTAAPTELTLDPEQQRLFYLQELARIQARQAAQRHFDLEREDDVVADRVRRKLLDDKAALEYRRVTEPPAPPFDLDTLGGVLARPDEPPMRIQGLMPWSGSALIVAQRKTGKTTLLLNYARALLTGDEFLGMYPVIPLEPGERVAFLNYEVSGKQLARWAHECGADPDRLILVNLRGRRNPLGRDDDRAQLAGALREHNVRSVIVDPFGRAYTGVSQNDNGEVQAFLVGLEEFVRSDVGALDLMLATHAGWDGERTRGASALEDWGDTIVTLTKDEDGKRFLRAMGRDVEVDEDEIVMDPMTRYLSMTGNGGRKTGAKNQGKIERLAVGAVRAATASPGCSRSNIRRALAEMDDMPPIARGGAGEELLTSVLKTAERNGFLRCEKGENGQASAYYATATSQTTPTTPDHSSTTPGVVTTTTTPPLYRGVVVGGGQEGTPANIVHRSVAGKVSRVNLDTGEVLEP